MDRRLTTIEVQMVNIAQKLDGHMIQAERSHDSMARLIDKLDARGDRQEIVMARMIGALVFAQFLAILFAPIVRSMLGLSTV